jgi:pimeloyl-ACP methyl ester carboxylesterase
MGRPTDALRVLDGEACHAQHPSAKEVQMPHITANDVELYYEVTGRGDPLVLVHGGWSDHDNWQPVAPALAESFLVVAYDRRGHGRSERGDQGTRRDQEDDLAALIETLDFAPAHIAGTSFGGSIALGLATRRPELVRSVVAHEPPLMALVGEDPEIQPLLEQAQSAIQSVLGRVARGDVEGGARQFVEEVALGPGAWEQLPHPLRQTMIDTAPTFAAEQQDPNWAGVDLAELARIDAPVLLTRGDQSPPWFFGIVAKLAETIDGAELRTYPVAGHAPHLTHPNDYIETVTDFLARSRDPATCM